MEQRRAGELIGTMAIRAADPRAPVWTLSGGNQQKTLFGKWLFSPPRVLLADEPTRGVDVGAKFSIYELIATLARQGMAVILISSELEELMGLAHRIVVMRAGTLVGEFLGPDFDRDALMAAAFGAIENDREAGL
jgi:ABC-type sugar transport system ATPase subunit